MAKPSQAAFTINGTPSADPVTGDRQFTALHGEVLSVTLEVNPSQALSATFEVFDAADSESPFASKDAPLLTWAENSLPAITVGLIPFGINDTVTITMPAAVAPPNPNIHSYVIRCTVSTPGDGSPGSQVQVFEREVLIFSLITTPIIRKTVPGETTQARARAWSDSLNDLIDAMENLSAGGGGGNLQDAYNTGNTIDVTLGNGPLQFSSTVAATQSPLTVRMDAVNVLEVDIVGAVDVNPTSGQDFSVTTGGVGDAVINTYTFPNLLVDTFSMPDTNGAANSVLTDTAGNGVLTFTALPSSYTTVEDEGTPLTQRTTIDFVGAGVTAADSGGVTTVTIPGGAATVTLQNVYDDGNTIVATAARAIAFSNAVDLTDLLTLTRTFVGAGDGLDIAMGPGNEAVTGSGINVVSGTAATGTMLRLNNLGTGPAVDIMDGGATVFIISGTGAITNNPTTSWSVQDGGTNVILMNADGSVGINPTSGVGLSTSTAGSGAQLFESTGSGAITVDQSGTGNVIVRTAAGNVDVDAIGGTLTLDGDAVAMTSTVTTIDIDANTTLDLTGGTGTTIDATIGNVIVNSVAGFLDLQVAGVTKVGITGAGAVNVTPTSGEDFTVTTLVAGDIVLNGATFDNAGSLDMASQAITNAGAVTSTGFSGPVNGVTLTAAGAATNFLDETGSYSVPPDVIAGGASGYQTGTNATKLNGIETAADVTDADNVAAAALLVETQTGTTYTLVNSDNGKLVTFNNAAAITVSLNTGLAAGFHCALAQIGAGQVTIAGTATLSHKDNHDKTEKEDAIVAIMYEGTTDDYLLGGATAA